MSKANKAFLVLAVLAVSTGCLVFLDWWDRRVHRDHPGPPARWEPRVIRDPLVHRGQWDSEGPVVLPGSGVRPDPRDLPDHLAVRVRKVR